MGGIIIPSLRWRASQQPSPITLLSELPHLPFRANLVLWVLICPFILSLFLSDTGWGLGGVCFLTHCLLTLSRKCPYTSSRQELANICCWTCIFLWPSKGKIQLFSFPGQCQDLEFACHVFVVAVVPNADKMFLKLPLCPLSNSLMRTPISLKTAICVF